jgi:hypothetical protein
MLQAVMSKADGVPAGLTHAEGQREMRGDHLRPPQLGDSKIVRGFGPNRSTESVNPSAC